LANESPTVTNGEHLVSLYCDTVLISTERFGKSSESVQCAIPAGPCLRMRHRHSA